MNLFLESNRLVFEMIPKTGGLLPLFIFEQELFYMSNLSTSVSKQDYLKIEDGLSWDAWQVSAMVDIQATNVHRSRFRYKADVDCGYEYNPDPGFFSRTPFGTAALLLASSCKSKLSECSPMLHYDCGLCYKRVIFPSMLRHVGWAKKVLIRNKWRKKNGGAVSPPDPHVPSFISPNLPPFPHPSHFLPLPFVSDIAIFVLKRDVNSN